MAAALFGDAGFEDRIRDDRQFQLALDRRWGDRFMVPQIGTGGYYVLATTRGRKIVSGWEAGPLYEEEPFERRAKRLERQFDIELANPRALPEHLYGTMGRLVVCDLLYAQHPGLRTEWLLGIDRWDVAKKLWDKYGYVTR